jgi:uncharacterized protein (TIGR03435 family)
MVRLQPGGRFVATNIEARELIRAAYELQDSQLAGGPGWLSTDRFDVTAKVPAEFADLPWTPTPPAGPASPHARMLRTLLADRFRLGAHIEPRELPVYALVIGERRQPGPGLRPSNFDCEALAAERRRPGAVAPASPPISERPVCGMRRFGTRLNAGAITMMDLIFSLSDITGRIVVDRTGLAGRYDIDLSFAQDRLPQQTIDPTGAAPAADSGPSLFTAVQEQLGLRLESTTAFIDVLVIDSIEQPTAD